MLSIVCSCSVYLVLFMPFLGRCCPGLEPGSTCQHVLVIFLASPHTVHNVSAHHISGCYASPYPLCRVLGAGRIHNLRNHPQENLRLGVCNHRMSVSSAQPLCSCIYPLMPTATMYLIVLLRFEFLTAPTSFCFAVVAHFYYS